MSEVPRKVQDSLEKHQMAQAGDRILVGVSGGPDSLCLLHILRNLGYQLGAAHLNHGLRGAESDEDEEFVRNFSDSFNVPCFVTRAQIDPESNVEEQGRQARQEFFAYVMDREGFDRIAIGHTREDRAETFLLHLFRGSGAEGLTSMAPVSGQTIRPLIEVSRAEVEGYLQAQGITWRIDSTNADLRFARNRVRHTVIPLIQGQFNPGFVETLSRTIEILADEDSFFRALVEEWMGRHATQQNDGLSLPVPDLGTQPKAFVRRVLRESLRRTGSRLDAVGFDHIEEALNLLLPGQSGKLVEIPGGIVVERSFDQLIVRPSALPTPDYDYELRIPGTVMIREIGRTITAQIIATEDAESQGNRALADAEMLGPCVRIRNWKAGDYYRPSGLPSGKLKRLFQRARIPRSQRHGWPVIVSDSTIVWVAAFPVSREFLPRAGSRKVVVFEASAL